MIRGLLCFVFSFAVAVLPASGEDMYGDLTNVSMSEPSSTSRRAPADILDDIEAILENLYAAAGNRYEVKVTACSSDDREFSPIYETANGNLKALWKEFDVALKTDMNASATNKDRAFAEAADNAVDTYKNHFGGNESSLLADYSKINKRVSSDDYQLRYNKLWFDKYVKMSSFTFRTPSTNPSQWSSSDVLYLIGIMPAVLRKDINMAIRSSYLDGYTIHAATLGISASAKDGGSLLGPHETFREMSIKTGNTDRHVEACKKAITTMESCEARARKFKDDNKLKRDKKGKMEFTGSKAAWNKLDSAYTDICNDMQIAMYEFTSNWDKFVEAFPGAASSDFGKAMDNAFNCYHGGFVYASVDKLDAKYEALRIRCERFKLERVTSSMFACAVGQSLYTPSSFRKPSETLYSEQRVILFLPQDIKTVVADRRMKAYFNGHDAAEAEYRREQAGIERERAAAAANNGGTNDWNDSSDSNWNNNNTSPASSDWNNNNTSPASDGWNDSNSDSGWNNSPTNINTGSSDLNTGDSADNNSGANTNTSGSDWNTGDAADNDSGNSWNDDAAPANNGW